MSVTDDEILELERRRDALALEADALARHNQARRAEALLVSTDASWPVLVVLLVAFAIGAAIGGTFFPTTRVYLVMCHPG